MLSKRVATLLTGAGMPYKRKWLKNSVKNMEVDGGSFEEYFEDAYLSDGSEVIRHCNLLKLSAIQGRSCKSCHEFVQVIVYILTLFIDFSVLYIINITVYYMHQLCFLYMLNNPVIYLLSLRENGNMHGTVFTLARLKIVPTITSNDKACL